MIFIAKFPILHVPIMKDRALFCRNHCPVLDSCYMCDGIAEDEVRGWTDEKDGRYLYILQNDTWPRRRRCPWCKEGGYHEEHTYSAHEKSMEEVLLGETQQALYQELVQVYRTGRWWAIGSTIGHCQGCVTPGSVKCSTSESPRNKLRCIFSLCLNPISLIGEDNLGEWWTFGFIVV